MGILKLLFILFLLIPRIAYSACSWVGNTGTVASPYDHVDVQHCVDDAASKTGAVIIQVPACTVDWDDRVLIDMSSGWANVTKLTIQGAGKGSTNITDTGTDTTYNRARLFHFKTITGKSVRLTGITFNNAGTTGTNSGSGSIYVEGTGTDVRLDTLSFPNLRRGSTANDYTGLSLHSKQGLVDNCDFTVPAAATTWGGNAIKFYGFGDASWESDSFTPGTAAAWYVENCVATFYKRGNDFWDAYGGARVVTRYNTVHGCTVGGHGNDSGNYASTHTQEFYNNVFDNICDEIECNGGVNQADVLGFRGGTGVLFNNVVDVTGINNIGRIVNYRSNPYHEGNATNASASSTVLEDSGQDFTSGEGIGPAAWVTSYSYIVNNTVNAGGTYYKCLTAHTSGVFADDLSAGKWTTTGSEYIFNQTKGAWGLITGSTATSITCSAGLSGGAQWETGNKYMHFYFFNDDLGCDGLGPNDGNVAGREGWPCKQQVGTTYEDGAYTYKPIYGWNNTFNGTTEGHLNTYTGSTRHSTYHVVNNQTYFNCDSAADCKADNDLVDISGFGLNAGWLYPGPYDCPHPLAELSGVCNPALAGASLSGGYNTDGTAPTISSFTIDPSGAFVTIRGSENLAVTTGAGYTLSSDGDAVTLTHTSISGTDIIQATSRTILSTETLTYSYTGTDTKDLSGNELGAITDEVVTNSSTQSGAVVSETAFGVAGQTAFSGGGTTVWN